MVASIYQYVVGIGRMRIRFDPAGVSGWCLWMLPRDVVLQPQTCLDSKQTLWPSHLQGNKTVQSHARWHWQLVKADNFHIVLFSMVLFACISIHWAVRIFLEQKKIDIIHSLETCWLFVTGCSYLTTQQVWEHFLSGMGKHKIHISWFYCLPYSCWGKPFW